MRVIRFAPNEQQQAAAGPAPAELIDALNRNNELLQQVLTELRTKKKFSFAVAKDAFGRLSHIDAEQK